MSADGAFTVVVIALLGNPFSARYARARRHGPVRALDHCALHVSLRGPNGARWSLRERAVSDDARGPGHIVLGGSRFGWDGQGLFVEVDETTTPGGMRVQGRVRLHPEAGASASGSLHSRMALDAAGDHVWWPVAPVARAEVDFRTPSIRFTGDAYADANAGRVPLESSFASWCWSRARVGGGRTVVAYDVVPRAGSASTRSLVFGPRGMDTLDTLVRRSLAPSAWGLARSVKADRGARAVHLVRSLEDGPCYARALVRTRILGRDTLAMHEVLSADRLRRAWVRFLLGFKAGEGAVTHAAHLAATYLVAVAVAAAMDLWAAFLHRFAWHGPLWAIHRTHHTPRPGRFERNDALSGLHAPIAIVLLVAGGHMAPGFARDVAVGAGAGMTAFGALYLLLHDGLVHGRLPVRFLARLPWLRAIAAAHREHHRHGGQVPYGILFGPLELAISRSRRGAASKLRAPPPTHPPSAPP